MGRWHLILPELHTIISRIFNHLKWRNFKLLRWVQILNRLVYVDEILYGDGDIIGDLDSVLRYPVASVIPKWLKFNEMNNVHITHIRLLYSIQPRTTRRKAYK
jgi:hypothetical protein